MFVPKAFSNRIIHVHGEHGRLWLNNLNELISFAEERWKLQVLAPFNLSFNYVAPVIFQDGTKGVLKIICSGAACVNELSALKACGEVMCRVIDHHADRGIILLERLTPGVNLKSIADDAEAVRIAASVIRKMKNRKLFSLTTFPTIADRALGISDLRKHFKGRAGPFSEKVIEKVEASFRDLIATQKDIYFLHGDFHHENILHHHGEWKLIDPKGLIGEMEYEITTFLINNIPDRDCGRAIENRISLFAKELNANAERIYRWGLCHSLLAAWWNAEDNLGVSDTDLAMIAYFNNKVL